MIKSTVVLKLSYFVDIWSSPVPKIADIAFVYVDCGT